MADAGRGAAGRLGFIGLGRMGLAMTLRLLEAGYEVRVVGREPDRVRAALGAGAKGARSPSSLAKDCDAILLCVSDTSAVAQVVFSSDGIASNASASQILVDHSTTDATRTREMAARLQETTGARWVDAPVSGGPGAARDGNLAVMCGAADEDFARVEPVLRTLGKNVTHMGSVGAGQVTKMVNQVLAGVTFATLAEALKLAENAGIDAARIPQCLAGGYADSAMLQRIYPKMVSRDFEPPAGLARQMLKDLEMLADLARATHTPTPMTSQARTLYQMLVARGLGDVDTSAILRLYE